MVRVNAELLAKIKAKQGIGSARAYALIAEKARTLVVDRSIAALAVASDMGININKKAYATDEQRAALAAATRGHSPSPQVAVVQPTASRVPQAKKRSARVKARKSNSVMVVHGRNQSANRAMFSFLRSIGLAPIEWAQAIKKTKKAAPYIGEILNTAFSTAAAVVVLLTPDDEARLKQEFVKPGDPGFESQLTGQARPNVLFEAGRAFGSHPESTVLVELGSLRPFSDTAGVHVVRLSNSVESRKELADRLEAAGCAVSLDGTDWMKEGDFAIGVPPATKRRKSG
jgi:predicted nucleotide-binding protein